MKLRESQDLAAKLEIPLDTAKLLVHGAHRRGFSKPIDYVQFLIDNEQKLLSSLKVIKLLLVIWSLCWCWTCLPDNNRNRVPDVVESFLAT